MPTKGWQDLSTLWDLASDSPHCSWFLKLMGRVSGALRGTTRKSYFSKLGPGPLPLSLSVGVGITMQGLELGMPLLGRDPSSSVQGPWMWLRTHSLSVVCEHTL